MEAAEREVLDAAVGDAIRREAAKGGAAVDEALMGLGWLEMLHAEPRDAIDCVFRSLGANAAVASVLDDVVVSALGTKPHADLAVLLPRYGEWDPPETDGLVSARAATAGAVLVVGRAGAELRASTVPISAVELCPVRGIDPDAGLCTAHVHGDRAAATRLDAEAWDAAVAVGRRAVAGQMAGACRTMLELARAHALERVQFGHPIARFQAVRHRLAEAFVAIEALEAALTAADDEPNLMTAALAKALAGRAARTVATHCQQVLGGVGFTTDHPFHRFLKRTMLLEGVFGSADEIVGAVGRRLLVTREVPTLIEL
jgi:hypothetical protein